MALQHHVYCLAALFQYAETSQPLPEVEAALAPVKRHAAEQAAIRALKTLHLEARCSTRGSLMISPCPDVCSQGADSSRQAAKQLQVDDSLRTEQVLQV